jgi:predicted transcriptional regulator
MLAVLAIFVIYAARSENEMVQTEDVMSRYKVRDVMRPNFTRLRSNDWMLTALELFRRGLERHFLVFDVQDNLVGVLEEDTLIRAIQKPNFTAEIGNFLHPVELVDVQESLSKVHVLMRQQGNGIVGVVENGELVGVVDEAGLAHFMRLEALVR